MFESWSLWSFLEPPRVFSRRLHECIRSAFQIPGGNSGEVDEVSRHSRLTRKMVRDVVCAEVFMQNAFRVGASDRSKICAAAALILAVGFIGCGGGSNGGDTNSGGAAGQGNDGTGGAGQGGAGQGGAGQGGAGQGGAGQGGGIVDPNLTAIFVAQGMVGRTIISCDGGNTWVGNRSDDDAFVCFQDAATDCDHHPGAGRGIAFGDGYFVATFGWGKPGSIRRSKNGVDWTNVLEGKTFAGVVHGDAGFLAGERPPQVSTDIGATWTAGGDPDSMVWNVRRTGYAAFDTGRYLLAFESSGATDINVSKDMGKTWARPTTLPASCAASMQWEGGFAYGNNTIVVLGGDGVACRSLDGGDTWTESNIGGSVSGRLLFGKGEFVTWGQTPQFKPVRFTSPDGATWTMTDTKVSKKNPDGTVTMSAGPNVGAVAINDAGTTYVAVNGGWQQWYDKQRFYRSNDGVNWDELPAGSFVGSHPIQFIAYGVANKSSVCP